MRFIVTTYIALLGLFAATAVHAAPFKVSPRVTGTSFHELIVFPSHDTLVQASDNDLVNVRRSGEIITFLESRAGQSPEAQTQAQQSPADHPKPETGEPSGRNSKVKWHPDVTDPKGSKYSKKKKIIVTFTGEAAGLDSEGKPLTSSSANAAKVVAEPQAVNVPPQIRIRLNKWAEDHFRIRVPIVYNGKYRLRDTDAEFSFTYRFPGDDKTEYPVSLPPVSHSPPAAAAADSDSSFDPRIPFSSDSD
ncbi:MAG: hypothetical protein NXY57DRAFT_673557 [Lentinula lateritia]|nr:MAG: hypothetical protein NXY57DRAFT_673557 [Lentinula lateritia]